MENNRKIAIIHRYFWPQNYPYALMLKDISETLIKKGANLSIYTSYSGSDEEHKQRAKWQRKVGVEVYALDLPSERSISIPVKAWYSIKFFVWLLHKLMTSRYDVFVVATTPPVVIAFLVSLISKFKGTEVVYHCQDIHPESLYVNRTLNSVFLYKFLKILDTFTVKNATKVVVLSQDMKKTLQKRGALGKNIYIVNNFIFHSLAAYRFKDLQKNNIKSKKIRFLFAGSLGHFQNLKLLIKTIGFFKDREDLEFLFLGDGPFEDIH